MPFDSYLEDMKKLKVSFSFISFMYSYTASFSDMLSLIATKVTPLSCDIDFWCVCVCVMLWMVESRPSYILGMFYTTGLLPQTKKKSFSSEGHCVLGSLLLTAIAF